MIEADIERAVKLLQSFQLPRDKQVGIKEKIMHKDERYFLHFFPIIRFDPGKNTMQRRYRKLFQEFFFVFGNFSQIRAIFTIIDLFLKKIEKNENFPNKEFISFNSFNLSRNFPKIFLRTTKSLRKYYYYYRVILRQKFCIILRVTQQGRKYENEF